MPEKLRILELEDDPDFSKLVEGLLEAEGFEPEIVVVQNRAEFESALQKVPFDIILADYLLPTCNGLELLEVARSKVPGTPFVLVSGAIGEEAAIESLKAGATDYVLKSSVNRLVPAIRRALNNRRTEEELQKAQDDLLQSSHLAGMAEVANSVLQNIGTVLNSTNISITLLHDDFRKSRIAYISRVAGLMREHAHDLGRFMTEDPRGKQLPQYISELAEHLAREQSAFLAELDQIRTNVEHIREVVVFHQSAAGLSGTKESVNVNDLLEDALRLSAGAFVAQDARIIREFDPNVPQFSIEKHKVLQILVNLIHNAKSACDQSSRPDKTIILRTSRSGDRVRISVADNGVGITAEDLQRVFESGFTTLKEGHGLGLRNSYRTARALGGTLSAHSDGPGKGATFTLELKLKS